MKDARGNANSFVLVEKLGRHWNNEKKKSEKHQIRAFSTFKKNLVFIYFYQLSILNNYCYRWHFTNYGIWLNGPCIRFTVQKLKKFKITWTYAQFINLFWVLVDASIRQIFLEINILGNNGIFAKLSLSVSFISGYK